MDSTRADALIQIMEIENQVKRVSRSKRYIKIQQYVQDLQNLNGRSILDIENPDDMGKIIQVRKNSTAAKEYLKQYELLLNEYTIQFKKLQERKKLLKTVLFK